MNRILLASSALILLLSSPAFAQTATTDQPAALQGTNNNVAAASDQVLATGVLGKTVYTGADEEGEAIGNVSDLVISASGQAEAVVIGVGGFLGIGEKDVAISFNRVTWSDRDGQRIIVVSATKEELQAAPQFNRTAFMGGVSATTPEAQSQVDAVEQPAAGDEQPAQTAVPMTGTTPEMTDPENPPIDAGTVPSNPPPEFLPVDPASINAEKLVGTEVKVADDTNVGKIADVILGSDGKVEAYIIDVGGFLGIGVKPVAMSAESVQVLADASGTMVIYSPFTRAQLENQVAYDEEAYKANPAGIILNAPRN